METVLANYLTAKAKRVVRNGRKYIVAPVSMIQEGVLSGSKGPLLYPFPEIKRTADAWNGMPAVVYHPVTQNGTPISARTPDVTQVGTVYDVRFRGKKMVANLWLDEEILRGVEKGTDIINRIDNSQPIEVSTGLFTVDKPVENGVHAASGRQYTHEATNLRPDHLAILPDQIGACSVKDGCGLMVDNNCGIGPGGFQHGNRCSGGGGAVFPSKHNPEITYGNKSDRDSDDRHFDKEIKKANREVKAAKSALDAAVAAHPATVSALKAEAASKLKMIDDTLNAKLKSIKDAQEARAAKAAAREKKRQGRLDKLKASMAEAQRLLTTNAESNFDTTTQGGSEVTKAELVTWLTTNCDCWKGKDDAATLNGMSEDKLKQLKSASETQKTLVTANAEYKKKAMEDEEKVKAEEEKKKTTNNTTQVPTPTVNNTPTPAPVAELSAEQKQLLANAEMIVKEKAAADRVKKQELANHLVANSKYGTEEARKLAYATFVKMPLSDLQVLAGGVMPTTNANNDPYDGYNPNPIPPQFPTHPSFFGAQGGPVNNAGGNGYKPEPIPDITVNWNELAAHKLGQG